MTNKSLEKVLIESLQPHQNELFQLTELTGLNVPPQIAGILIRMLNLNVSPEIVYQLLKCIRRSIKSTKYKKTNATP
ncbi:hypothetical protein FQR65_LT11626 [Abscondita terminalis]|nr:hypothetical protein FQR65_LT11626 [Abscondita terminalis]